MQINDTLFLPIMAQQSKGYNYEIKNEQKERKKPFSDNGFIKSRKNTPNSRGHFCDGMWANF
ncbi:hypothetical protein S4054249_21045 [Pseudoalteromonas luteoviolacea]|uniref:Uncharacterized protein n=1 Tax=Pseudoalteromonas luteoviolacea S4054 TaxID=1129367 RepID=A0A0F6AAE0_9GAMM|nr:hypothetical protein S4054249_21045 [Pseudoalteromonas luteoviolacea]AOT15563.1 hypothetical protein S40542_22545 [Pseudoalteromonas luteoviolacea]AOT20186.1 hypothetical protein S4054_20960 [Pseudoalteromonas luteoviolacea]KKE83177.1 hypothetical protein N479_15460 [Pseudoalteromonas luteoviolacea S4054]KZN66695.1 hypothetical protein N481_24160 [Pseudoalteromonas luteoviolacea S4047-1]